MAFTTRFINGTLYLLGADGAYAPLDLGAEVRPMAEALQAKLGELLAADDLRAAAPVYAYGDAGLGALPPSRVKWLAKALGLESGGGADALWGRVAAALDGRAPSAAARAAAAAYVAAEGAVENAGRIAKGLARVYGLPLPPGMRGPAVRAAVLEKLRLL